MKVECTMKTATKNNTEKTNKAGGILYGLKNIVYISLIVSLFFSISGVVGACNNTANYTIHEWGVWQQEYYSNFTHIYGMPPKNEVKIKIGAKIGKPVIYFHSNESFNIDIGILFNYPNVTNIITLPNAYVSYNEINWDNFYIENNSIIEYNNTYIDPSDSYVRLYHGGSYLSFPIDGDTITRIDDRTFKYKYLFYEGDVVKPLGVEAHIFDNKTTAIFYIKNLANHTIYDVFLVYMRDMPNRCAYNRCGSMYYSAAYTYIPQLNAYENTTVTGDIIDNKSLIKSSITQKVSDKLINQGLTLDEANELIDYWSPRWFGKDTSFVLYTMPQEIYDNELPIVMCPKPEDTTRIGMFYVEDIPVENPLTCNETYEILRAAWQKKEYSKENLIELILYGAVSITVTFFCVFSMAAIILAIIYKILRKRQIGEILLILFCLLAIILMSANAISELDIISSPPSLPGESPGGYYYWYDCKQFHEEIQRDTSGFGLLLYQFNRLSGYWFHKYYSQLFFWPILHIFFVLMFLEYITSRIWKYSPLLSIPIITWVFIFFVGAFWAYPLYAFSFLTVIMSTYLGFRRNKKYLIGTILLLFGTFLAAILDGWGHRIFGETVFILSIFYLIWIALRNLLPSEEIIGKNFIFIWLGLIIVSGWLDYSLIWRPLLVIGIFYVCWILLKGFRNKKIKLENSSSDLFSIIKELKGKI